MFERFGKAARLVVRDAVYLAEQDKAAAVWPEHLLLSMLRQDGSTGTTILANHAVTTESVNAAIKIAGRRGGLSESESAALAELGIDVDAIVTAVEEAHGPGALAGGRKRQRARRTPFSRESKKVPGTDPQGGRRPPRLHPRRRAHPARPDQYGRHRGRRVGRTGRDSRGRPDLPVASRHGVNARNRNALNTMRCTAP